VRRLITWGRPTEPQLRALLAEVRRSDVSYDHVGSTLEGPGHQIALGRGDAAFAAGVAGLRAWACHAGIGATIEPPDAPLAEGTDVLVVLRLGPFRLLVPDRIVVVVDEPHRFGFAYGTLPGHPERGEESFVVQQADDGAVTATIRVEAEGAWLLARIAAPVTSLLQRAALRRYLAALRRYVEEATT
jgi:uncharacterized protein (UPF0548 family)